MYSEKFQRVVDSVLDVINKQEQMHAVGMQTNREVGAEVMFFSRGVVAIEPDLSCSGVEIEVGKEVIDPEAVAEFLNSCSTSFRNSYNAEADTACKTPLVHIKHKKTE